MKQIIKKFNNFIKKTIFKLENKTNSNFKVSTFNKYIITIIGVLFAYIFYLLIPLLYDKNWIQEKITTNLSTEFNINLNDSLDIYYRILPKPHYLIKNNKTSLGEIKVLNAFIGQNSFFNKDNIRINKVVIKEANFSLLNNDLKKIYNNSEDKFSEKKINISNSNIFFKNNLNEIISIIKISNAFIFFDEINSSNSFKLKGEIFNIPFNFKYQNIIPSQKKKIDINAPDLKLKIINEIFKMDGVLTNGINDISFLSSSLKTKFNIDDKLILFQSDNSVGNNNINYNGKLAINPFDLNLEINLDNYQISNFFRKNFIISEFIKSGLLFNENISVNSLVNIKFSKKNKMLNDAKLYFKILNGKIDFNNTILTNNNIGLIKISNSDLFLENDRLILDANLSIDIKNTDKLFSFLNTNKKSRKDIKKIKFNIIYDFLSNQAEFKNIRIDGNNVSEQFYNIVEGFSDNNSNNLTKSRRLLNKLFSLYEG